MDQWMLMRNRIPDGLLPGSVGTKCLSGLMKQKELRRPLKRGSGCSMEWLDRLQLVGGMYDRIQATQNHHVSVPSVGLCVHMSACSELIDPDNGWQYMPASNRPIAGGSGCPSSWLNSAGRAMPIVVADLAFPRLAALRQCYRLKALSWPQRLLIEFL